MKYVDPTADAQNLTRVAPNHALEPSKVKNRGPQRFLGYPGRFPLWDRKIFRPQIHQNPDLVENLKNLRKTPKIKIFKFVLMIILDVPAVRKHIF